MSAPGVVLLPEGAVAVDLDGPAGEEWRQCADVLWAGAPRPAEYAALLVRRVLRDYPGCALVVVACSDPAGVVWGFSAHPAPPGAPAAGRRDGCPCR
ncbi:hypothetical protein [Streptomyces tremellae]|uniref:Uncharacterized protein n=1 Tax=Streptomyces tremellae TaxID=1124239 RepID=A0ABP7FR34_9ACTN